MCRCLLCICPLIHGCPPVICPSRPEWWSQLRMGFRITLTLNDPFCCKGCAHGKVLLLAGSRGVKQSYQAPLHTYTKLDTRQTQTSSGIIAWCHKLFTSPSLCRKNEGWCSPLPSEEEKCKQFTFSSAPCPSFPYLTYSYWSGCVFISA